MQATHWLIRFLRRRKREGLATAITNLVTELTLVGVVRCRNGSQIHGQLAPALPPADRLSVRQLSRLLPPPCRWASSPCC